MFKLDGRDLFRSPTTTEKRDCKSVACADDITKTMLEKLRVTLPEEKFWTSSNILLHQEKSKNIEVKYLRANS